MPNDKYSLAFPCRYYYYYSIVFFRIPFPKFIFPFVFKFSIFIKNKPLISYTKCWLNEPSRNDIQWKDAFIYLFPNFIAVTSQRWVFFKNIYNWFKEAYVRYKWKEEIRKFCKRQITISLETKVNCLLTQLLSI